MQFTLYKYYPYIDNFFALLSTKVYPGWTFHAHHFQKEKETELTQITNRIKLY